MTPVLASASPTFPVLPALIVVPLLGALLVVVVPRRRTELLKLVAVLATMATGALSLWLLFAFNLFSAGLVGLLFSNGYILLLFLALFVRLRGVPLIGQGEVPPVPVPGRRRMPWER